MSTIIQKCPACDADLPLGARFCPNCGFVLSANSGSLPPTTVIKETMVTTSLDDTPYDASSVGGGGLPPEAAPPAVVFVPPPVMREAPPNNNGLVITLLSLGLVAVVAVVVWNLGYLSHAAPGTTTVTGTPPSSISIENPPASSPQAAPNITLQTSPPAAQPPATTPAPAPLPAPAPAPAPQPAAPPSGGVPPVDVVSVSAQATDTTAAQWHYGYTLKLRNNTSAATHVNLRIKFLDADGYVVDDDVMNNVFIPANTEQDYEDYKQIDAATAAKVKSVKAELR